MNHTFGIVAGLAAALLATSVARIKREYEQSAKVVKIAGVRIE